MAKERRKKGIFMKKNIFILLLGVIFLASFSFILIGEEEKDNIKEVSFVKNERAEETLYRVMLTEDGEIAVYAEKGGKDELIRKEMASPLRKKDEEVLKEGILTKNLEEALMIFEDFIS